MDNYVDRIGYRGCFSWIFFLIQNRNTKKINQIWKDRQNRTYVEITQILEHVIWYSNQLSEKIHKLEPDDHISPELNKILEKILLVRHVELDVQINQQIHDNEDVIDKNIRQTIIDLQNQSKSMKDLFDKNTINPKNNEMRKKDLEILLSANSKIIKIIQSLLNKSLKFFKTDALKNNETIAYLEAKIKPGLDL